MNHELIEKQFYEKYWKNVNRTFSKNSSHFSSDKPSSFVTKFKNEKGLVLDIGCGNGRHTKLFKNSIGIDVSESACIFAKQNSKKQIVKASVLHLPFKSNVFGMILDAGCLHHLRKSQWKLYKNNITNAMKKDSSYILYCFSSNSGKVKNFMPSKKRNFTLRSGHYNHFFTEKEITNIFKKDFKILKLKELKKPDSALRFFVLYAQKI